MKRLILPVLLFILSSQILSAQETSGMPGPEELNYFVTTDMEGFPKDYLFGRAKAYIENSSYLTLAKDYNKTLIQAEGDFPLYRDPRGKVPKGNIRFQLDFTAFDGAYKCVLTGMTLHGKFVESLEKATSDHLKSNSWETVRLQSDEQARRIILGLHDFIENLPVFDLDGVTIDDRRVKIDAWKPVIYLYPKRVQKVKVDLDFEGELSFTYPEYGEGWEVTAHPDGRIEDESGRSYNYLFWEGPFANNDWQFDQGFVVPGNELVPFFEKHLAEIGLSSTEANDFITFWAPKMQDNEYNLIHFAFGEYSRRAQLTISPEPDAMRRVFMLYQALDAPVKITPQILPAFERHGFTVIEWGGAELPLGL